MKRTFRLSVVALAAAACQQQKPSVAKAARETVAAATTATKTAQRKTVVFANFYGAAVPQALTTLGLGNRSEEINPDLAGLGWNVGWENEEWWANSPKLAPGTLVSK